MADWGPSPEAERQEEIRRRRHAQEMNPFYRQAVAEGAEDIQARAYELKRASDAKDRDKLRRIASGLSRKERKALKDLL